MNKVTCNICGTSYPENAAQCPICGFVHNTDNNGLVSLDTDAVSYKHVKGGRYSKSNVRRRNESHTTSVDDAAPLAAKRPVKKKSGKGLTAVVIILLLAIIAVVGYIALRFFIPNMFIYEGMDHLNLPFSDRNDIDKDTEDTALNENTDIACTAISLADGEIVLQIPGQTYQLTAVLEPAQTTEAVSYISGDPAVATVDDNGQITAVSEGSATVTVTCGAYSAECTVTCEFPEPTTDAVVIPENTEVSASLALNRKEITFDMEGQSWLLYDGGELSVYDIVWSSDDLSVATIDAGKVVAVANGSTTVYGSYDGQVVSCAIHCQFNDDSVGADSGISEAGGDTPRSYKLHNPYGYADDVTLHVGEQFTLLLVDESENKIEGAQWSVGDTNCCTYENDIVNTLAVGTTEITATYEGTSYTCIVRIVE